MLPADKALQKVLRRLSMASKKLVLDTGYDFRVECNVSRDECFSHHHGDENDGCWDCPQFQKILDKLFRYESIDPEPENLERVMDAYGRGMTLRTENAMRLNIIKDIPTLELDKLVDLYCKNNISKTTVSENSKFPEGYLEKIWGEMLQK